MDRRSSELTLFSNIILKLKVFPYVFAHLKKKSPCNLQCVSTVFFMGLKVKSLTRIAILEHAEGMHHEPKPPRPVTLIFHCGR